MNILFLFYLTTNQAVLCFRIRLRNTGNVSDGTNPRKRPLHGTIHMFNDLLMYVAVRISLSTSRVRVRD